MYKNSKIYVAGHTGLVGSAILRILKKRHYENIIFKTHKELDLTNFINVENFFKNEKPDVVIIAAAKVGGILANMTYPVDFMLENLKIQNNLFECAYKYSVKKLIFLGSSCIYPKNSPQPIKEEHLLSSKLEETNEAYALAKICGVKLCEYYNRQHNTNYLAVMPCNLYGINDFYHNENAHVIPMLIQRFHNAKINNETSVTIWGSGKPCREFLFADDLAEAVVLLLQNDYNDYSIINVGSGKEISIRELAFLIRDVVNYNGEILFDNKKPDGTLNKLLDVSRIFGLGWAPTCDLESGLKITYKNYLENINK